MCENVSDVEVSVRRDAYREMRERGDYDVWLGRPLGPNIDGIGFRLAFAIGILGTPWMTLGSFISVGSSFDGTRPITAR
jgi:hypothetical protein